MALIFISYAHEDRAFVDRLAEALESEQHTVWFDRGIRGGERFSDRIRREIDLADVVIVVWSAAAAGSNWVPDEAGLAQDRGKLVPVALALEAIPIGFRQQHAVSFADFDGRLDHSAFRQVLAAIETGRDGGPDRPDHPRGISAAGLVQVVSVGGAVAAMAGASLAIVHWASSSEAAAMSAASLVLHQLLFAAIPALVGTAVCSWRVRRLGLKGTRALVAEMGRCLLIGALIALTVVAVGILGRTQQVATGVAGLGPAAIAALSATLLLTPFVALARLLFGRR